MNDDPTGADLILLALKRGAVAVQGAFNEPDDDWSPVAMVEYGDGRVVAFPIPELQHPNTDVRQATLLVLSDGIVKRGVTAFGLIQSVWQVSRSQEGLDAILDGSEPRARDADDKKEMLTIVTIDSEGRFGGSSAEIQRYESSPPTFGEWDDIPTGAEAVGDMLDPIKEAMAYVRVTRR